jgi:hypothetical protein
MPRALTNNPNLRPQSFDIQGRATGTFAQHYGWEFQKANNASGGQLAQANRDYLESPTAANHARRAELTRQYRGY